MGVEVLPDFLVPSQNLEKRDLAVSMWGVLRHFSRCCCEYQALRLAACLLSFLGRNMPGKERKQHCPEAASQKKKGRSESTRY